jgi:hypothetical protein
MKKSLFFFILPFLIVAVKPEPPRDRSAFGSARAASAWEALGPYGGFIAALAANPADANEIFAAVR